MEKINEIYLQLPLFIQNAARIENCVRTLAQTVAAQIVWSPVARVTSLKTIAASGSSSPDSARSWNMLGQSSGSPASVTRGSHGQGHPMTIGIRDVDLILFQALKTNMHGVPSSYCSHVNNTTLGLQRLGKTNIPVYKKTRQNSLQSRFRVGQTRIRNKSQVSGLCGPI